MTSLRSALEGLLALTLVALVAWLASGYVATKRERADAGIRIAALNGQRLAEAARFTRDTAAIRAAERERAETAERAAAARIDARLNASNRAVADARAVLADSLANTAMLRNTAMLLADQVDSLAAEVVDYRAQVDGLRTAYTAERVILMQALVYADSSATAWKRAYELRTDAAECRVLFVPCPSRPVSFLLGAVTVAAVLVVAR